ncbi:unnamed protein product [marine sediment metagenome]|uniref:Uncharacterized protein n=1 Tax=marine sediment metagenome TaxID=412755 RepID=X0ZME2_9ZZZZ
MSECNCNTCKMSRNWRKAKELKDIQSLDDIFNELFSMYEHAQLDHEVLQAVMDGVWPNSVQRLEHALTKAKLYEAKEVDENDAD